MVHVPPSEDEGLSVLVPSSRVFIHDSAYLDSAFMGAEFGIHRLEFGSVNVSPRDASELRPPGTGLGTASFRARPINLTKHRFDSVSGNTVQHKKKKRPKELKYQTPMMHWDVFKVFWRQRASVTH